MGCSISKSPGEPRTLIIRLPSGCSNIVRSFSSPSHLAVGEHVSEKPSIDSAHAVSLTSSTYGSLQLDPLEDHGEVRSRRGSSEYLMDGTSENSSKTVNRPVSNWSGVIDSSLSTSVRNRDNKKAIPLKGANNNKVEIIDMWELMEGVEDEKALKMLRALVEKPSMSGFDSGKSTPRLSTTIHTIEDVDNVLDDGGSLPTGYRFRRGSSLEAAIPVHHSHESGLNSDRMIGRTSAMLQKRRARAMQISKDVISELDELRRRNLSRSQEFNTSGRSILSRSQEFNSSGRRDMSRSQEFITTERRGLSRIQEFNPARRRYLSQSEDYDSTGRNRHIRSPNLDHVRRGNLFKNQEHDSRKNVQAVESQEFAEPPLAKPKEVVARRHSSHEIPRIVELKDERVTALSKPDIVLRSPMLRGIGGVERQRVRPGQGSSLASAAINIESTKNPSLRSQTLPPTGRKTMPKAADPTMMNLDLNT